MAVLYETPKQAKIPMVTVLTVTLVIMGMASVSPVHSAVLGSIQLRPPFSGSFPIVSWFDHLYPNYSKIGGIRIFDGELNGDCDTTLNWNYCYDGHSGIDFALPILTPLLAAADGIVEVSQDVDPILPKDYGTYIVIRHSNGIRTLYGHLTSRAVSVGNTVHQGDQVGLSGSTGNSTGPHLHFGVYEGTYSGDEANATDPFGWLGDDNDPLIGFHGHRSECLWRSAHQDQVSCADTIIEDGHVGFGGSAGWEFDTTRGSSFGFHYRLNSYEVYPNAFALWANDETHGSCGVYVWVPANNATSHNVEYRIWAYVGQDWNREISADRLDQGAHSNEWVYLRSVPLNATEYPAVTIADMWTGEPLGTQWIAADAVKFRCYKAYILPVASPP